MHTTPSGRPQRPLLLILALVLLSAGALAAQDETAIVWKDNAYLRLPLNAAWRIETNTPELLRLRKGQTWLMFRNYETKSVNVRDILTAEYEDLPSTGRSEPVGGSGSGGRWNVQSGQGVHHVRFRLGRRAMKANIYARTRELAGQAPVRFSMVCGWPDPDPKALSWTEDASSEECSRIFREIEIAPRLPGGENIRPIGPLGK